MGVMANSVIQMFIGNMTVLTLLNLRRTYKLKLFDDSIFSLTFFKRNKVTILSRYVIINPGIKRLCSIALKK